MNSKYKDKLVGVYAPVTKLATLHVTTFWKQK